MADGRCLNADILASLLLGNNEAFAKEVVELTNRLNAAKIMSSRGNKTVAKNIEKNIRMQINGIVSSRILIGDAGKEAKESLMKTIRHKGGTIGEGAKLLELIDGISLANADEYAGLLFKEGVDAGTKKEAIDGFKKAVADFVASKNQLNKNFGTKISAKAKGIKDRVKFIGELWKAEKKQTKAAKKKGEKEVPKEVLSPDETWKSIVNLMESDKKDSEILFNNYVLGRIFLGEDEDILVDFLKVEGDFNNTMPTLTIDDVKGFKTIDSLIERVYTNALDIARDKDLRKELKLKLLELIQGQNGTKANQYKRAINVINTLMFADTGVSFSTTLKYSNIGGAIREVLVDDNGLSRVSDSISNESLYEELKELLERDKLLLGDKDNPRHIEAFGTKITGEELLKIIYAASWDESVKAAIELAGDVPDDVIVKFAGAKLFGINQKQGEKNMRDLLKNFRKPYNVTEVSSIAFKATSGRNVVPTNNTSIVFFNFNKAENALNANIENDTLLSRARFNDDLSNLYTLTVTTDTIPSYDISDGIEGLSDDILKNIEYIVLPNGNRRNDYRLTRLKERLKSLGNDKYQIIYPKSRQSGQYFVDVDGRLKFKTTSERLYNEMSNKLAIESLNSATIDLTENTNINRQLIDLSNEQKKQALNDSAMNFFRHYMGTAGEGLSDEQLIKRISEMTGIPINDAGTTNWELAQRVLYNNYTATGRYSKQVVTEADIDNILKEIDSYDEADLIKALKDDGFIIDENIVKKNTSIIKEAYKNLRTTGDLTEYLWYKGVVNGLSNKNSVTDIGTIEFQKILTSPNPREELAKYLYGDRVLSESEFKSVEDYLGDILDSFTSKMIDNLTKDGYQIPMISPRRAMMEYLRGTVSTSNEFIDAFIYKNGLDADYNIIKQIFDDHLPNEIEIKGVISADTLKNMRTPNNGLVVKELSPEERFLPTTYNSYSAVLEQMNLPKEKFPNSIVDDAVYLNEDEVREVLRRFFTEEELKDVNINFYNELIDGIADGRYSRQGMKRFLKFIRNPEELTPYHETLHMYLDMFVNDDDKIALLDEIWKDNKKEIQKYIRDNKIKQEDFFRTPEEAQKSKFSFFNKVTEEWAADNFIKFVKDQDIKLKKKTRNIFQKIWDFLTSWGKDRTEEQLDALNQLYSDIYNRVRPEGGTVRREGDANYYQSAFHRVADDPYEIIRKQWEDDFKKKGYPDRALKRFAVNAHPQLVEDMIEIGNIPESVRDIIRNEYLKRNPMYAQKNAIIDAYAFAVSRGTVEGRKLLTYLSYLDMASGRRWDKLVEDGIINPANFGKTVKEETEKSLRNTRAEKYIRRGPAGGGADVLGVHIPDWSKMNAMEAWDLYNKLSEISEFLIHKAIYDTTLTEAEKESLFDSGVKMELRLMNGVMPGLQDDGNDFWFLPFSKTVKGKDYKEFVNEYTDGGYSPIELLFELDDEGKIINGTVGVGTSSNATTAAGTRVMHNHPDGSFFSDGDLYGALRNGKKTIGITLPGGVMIEIPVSQKNIDIIKKWRSYYLPEYGSIGGTELSSTVGGSVYRGYKAAEEIGVLDNQEWGRFTDIVNNGLNRDDIKDMSDTIMKEIYEKQRDFIEPNRDGVYLYHRTKRRPTIDDYDINTVRDDDGRVVYRTYINRNLFSRGELAIKRVAKEGKVNLNELSSEINILRDERRISNYEYQILKSKIEDCRKDGKLGLEVSKKIFDDVLGEWKRDYPIIAARDGEWFSNYGPATEKNIDTGDRETRVYVIRKLENISKGRYVDAADYVHFPIHMGKYEGRYPELLFHARHEDIVDNKGPQIYRIIEIQSDTFQHGSSYRDAIAAFGGDEEALSELNSKRLVEGYPTIDMLPESKRISEEEFKLMRETWADRAISEEINNALNNGFKKVQFPYYGTIRNLEGFGDFHSAELDVIGRAPYFSNDTTRRPGGFYEDVPVSMFGERGKRLVTDEEYAFADGVWEDYYTAIAKGLPHREGLYKTARTIFQEYMDGPGKKLLDEDYKYTKDDYDFVRECLVSTNSAPAVGDYDNLNNTALREEFNNKFNQGEFGSRMKLNKRLIEFEEGVLSKEEGHKVKIGGTPNLERLSDGTYKLKNDEYPIYANEMVMKILADDDMVIISKDSLENYKNENNYSKKQVDEILDRRIAKSKKLLDKASLIAKGAIPDYEKIVKINENEGKGIRENIWEYGWKKFIMDLSESIDKNSKKLDKLIASADKENSLYISKIKEIQASLTNMKDDIIGYVDTEGGLSNIDNAVGKDMVEMLAFYIDEISFNSIGGQSKESVKHANIVAKYTEDYIPRFKNLVKDMFGVEAHIEEDGLNRQWLTIDLTDPDIDINNAPYIAYHRARNDKTKNIGNPTLTEDNVIEDILNKYEKAVEKGISGKEKMTVKESQDLKQQASYALNTAVQDLILSRYGSILNASDREGLLGLGYNLKLASNEKELEILKEANRQTMANFRRRWGEVAQQYNTLLRNPEELDKRLMESGRVYTERNGQQAIVDVWEELENSIKSIPDTAGEITTLKQMDSKNIRGLKPKQAYTLLKTIDLVKNNITRGNFYTQLMYQLNPQLRQAENGLNFFQTFKVVDMGGGVWIPWSLTNNATAGYVQAGKSVADASDLTYKADITKAIYNLYIKVGKELKQKDLENIVGEVLGGTMDTEYAQHYIDAFAPYISLKGLSPDVVTYVNNLLNTESKEVQGLLKEVGADLDSILDMNVILDDGSSVRVGDMINGNVNGWQERLFGGLSNNGEEKFFISKDRASNIKEEIKSAYSWYNGVDLVTQNEAHVITSLFGNARKILQRDTNTKKFIEFDNSIGGQNDILKQLMELHLFGGWKYGKNATWVQRTINGLSKIYSTGVNSRWWFDPKRWGEVQLLYETYYSRSLEELKNMPLPEDGTHQIALELAKYFKELEMRLGSKNGATGVSIDTSVNRAFGNLGSIVRNIHTDKGVYSLMNKIGNNQVLGLFKFAKKGDSAYNDFLYKLSTDNIGGVASTTYAYNYKEFVNGNMEEIARQFNTMFGSNFSKNDVNIILQGLGGYQIVNQKWNRWVRIVSNYISGFGGRTARLLMTYPYQLFTIYNQIFAYNVKANSFKRELGVEDVGHTNDIRKELGILEGTYVDFDGLMSGIRRGVSVPVRAIGEAIPDRAKNFMLDVIGRDSDEVAKAGIEFDDGIMGLYGKTTSYVSNNYDIIKMSQLFDSVKDNANNIIDAAHSQTFKGLAFLKALQKNDYIQFMNADAFKAFMNRTDISQAVKDKLLDRVNIYSNRIFQDMLGIGFSGLDKVYGGNALTDFLSGVLGMINFKGAWGTNIFRQTFEKLGSLLKVGIEYAKGNKATADEMWAYIVRTPEFSNLSTCLWGDLVMSWKMAKFAKNGQLPDDESEIELMDYVGWVKDNIGFISQQWQGLQSFGGMRPFTEAIRGVYYNMDKGPLGALGAGNNAFWATLASNVGRNWKPVTFIADALLIAETDGIDAAWKFVEDNWHTISAGTMRYMVEEGYNAYGVNNALTVQRGGIPALLVGEQYANSDTAFMYDVNKWTSSGLQLLSNAINTSQFFKLGKVLVQGAVQGGYKLMGEEAPDWTKSKKGVYNLMSIKDDLNESQTFRELWDTGKPMPKTQKQLQNLLDDYMKPNYPGGYKAYVGLQNYIETGTLNGRGGDEGNYYDNGLEQFYKKIEEKKPGELKDFLERFTTAYLGDPNSEQARIDFYNWAREWLNRMEGDPDYNLYASAMFKGNLNNLYYEVLDKEAEIYSWERTGMGYTKDQTKVSRSDIDKMKNVKQRINERFLAQHYDEMYAADMELMQHNFYQWIADELEPEVANGYFTQQKKKDWENKETDELEWALKGNIKNQIQDEIFFEKAIKDGRWEDALTYASIMTQSLAYDDETGETRAAMCDYYADRIINSDWPATVKQSALAWLIHNNEQVFTYDGELAEKYGDYYDAATQYKNEVLHNTNERVIDTMNNLAIALHEDTTETTKTAKSGVKLSNLISKLSGSLESSQVGKVQYNPKKPDNKFLAIPIKGLSAMGYKSPKKPADFNFEVVYKSKGYDPKTKTLGPITPPKKNKAVKAKSTRKMTQKEENELDLI